jgi:hypothetical protein
MNVGKSSLDKWVRQLLLCNLYWSTASRTHLMKMFTEIPEVFFSSRCDSAILYSFVETAKTNGLMVDSYLQTCLEELAKKPDNLTHLLPWNIN